MGALGVVRGNGDLELALTIRTFAIAEGRIHLWVGGGIVWDSEPEAEIEESWTKARPLLAAIGGIRSRWERDDAARGRGRRAAASSIRPSRCCAPTTRRCCAAGRRSRRCGSTAAGRSSWPSTSTGSPARPSGSGCRPVNRLELAQLAQQALDAAGAPDAVLRLYWTPTPVSIALVSALADHYDDLRARGQQLISLRGVRADEPWLLPGVKSTSYAVNMAAEAEARRRGADDAVFVDADAIVLEGPTTNVWWRRERTLFTPSLDLGILAGVTRATVLELARRLRLHGRGGPRSA